MNKEKILVALCLLGLNMKVETIRENEYRVILTLGEIEVGTNDHTGEPEYEPEKLKLSALTNMGIEAQHIVVYADYIEIAL